MNEKENALTFDDFKKKKIVLLSDEAHHTNVSTKTRQMKLDITAENPNSVEKPTWENTVEKIFTANDANLLLEFTATFDDKTPAIIEKYRNKIIYRYDLVKLLKTNFAKKLPSTKGRNIFIRNKSVMFSKRKF